MKRTYFWLLGALALFSVGAHAQVFVKASGHKAVPVRVTDLSADVEINGAIAVTNWSMTVQMENVGQGGYDGGVAEWIMARPRDAKVTAFFVNPNNTNLYGHVVTKAAAQPRATFAAAPDDPLLRSGLNASNSFRATVFPIDRWNEVSLSGTWVQVLGSAKGRSLYRLPLLSLRGATTRLKTLNVKINVRDKTLAGLSNDYGLPAKSSSGARVFTLGQKNYRVTRDLTVTLARAATSQQGTLLFAPNADKTGGYFALALSDGTGAQLQSENAGETNASNRGATALLTGAYAGDSNQLKFKATRNNVTRELQPARVENDIAEKLWATQRINALGNSPARRAEVIALSKAHDIESIYTTWLTVDDDNLRLYQRALVDSQLDVLVREYWIRLSEGQEKSARVGELKKSIALISKANNLTYEDELYTRLGSAYGYILWQKYGNSYQPENKKFDQKKVKARIARLGKIQLAFVETLTGKKIERSTDWYSPIYGGELGDLRGKIMDEYRKPHPDYAQLEKWQHRFSLLYGSTLLDPRLDFWRAHLTAEKLEAQTTAAEKAGDQNKLAKLQTARNENSRNAYFVNNIGDPPIYVTAPANAKSVVAVMPNGQVKTLDYNADAKRWEGNYDVPTTTKDGLYTIQIVIVQADNSRRRYGMQFRVDTAAPRGIGLVARAPGAPQMVRLQIEHDGDVARVTALLPWGERVDLLPSTTVGHRFFATVKAPPQYAGKAIQVRYILVDRAHNLTTIEAESVSTGSTP